MQKEIVNLLKKENKISDETISEIKNIDLNDFSNIVKEIGKGDTEYIKASEISKALRFCVPLNCILMQKKSQKI